MPDYQLVGRKIGRLDGADKVTGREKYMTDRKFPGMLTAMVLRAKYPHALIKGIAADRALRAEGIRAVLTARDIPGRNGFGIAVPDQPVLCDRKVRYLGDPVALVVAEDEAQAAKALKLIDVDYQPLPTVATPEEALEPDSVKIHDRGNIFSQVRGGVGDIEQAFHEADLVVEKVYTTKRQEHAFIETEGGIGVPTGQGVTIYHPSQYCYRDRQQLALILNLPEEKIKIVSSPVGGAFGGKDDLLYQALLALAALKTGCPVKIHASREESFLIGITRQPFKIRMRTAVRRDGRLLGQDTAVLCDIGAYASLGGAIMNFALENSTGCYYFPHVRIEGRCVYTNNQITGEFRGFGNNQMHFALESQLDIIARRLGLDPFELRLMNCLQPGQSHSLRQSLHTGIGAADTLQAAAGSSLWRRRESFKEQVERPWLKRGVGVALCLQGVGLGKGLPDSASAAVEVSEDGVFSVAVSTAELGQGSSTTMAIIAGETLGIRLERIRVTAGDTSLCPDSGTATASRSTYITGKVVQEAAAELKERLIRVAAELAGTISDRIRWDGGRLLLDGQKEIELTEAVGELRRRGLARVTRCERMPETDRNPIDGLNLHYLSGYLAEVVGVEVNTLTGKVEVVATEVFPDAGRVINRLGYEGQVEGGVVMGMGYALMENFQLQEGRLLTENLQSYLIPTAADIPEIKTTPVEVLEKSGPFGAKGLGEIPTIAVTPAIINAIDDAVGVRVCALPATPERVYRLMREKAASQ